LKPNRNLRLKNPKLLTLRSLKALMYAKNKTNQRKKTQIEWKSINIILRIMLINLLKIRQSQIEMLSLRLFWDRTLSNVTISTF